MNVLRILFLATLALPALTLVSCETTESSGPKIEGERLSSMPHNMPAPWEGQAGMPGMMSGQY